MRNLTKTLAVVSLLVPASAYSLGIGEIKLHSALNQNLDAEIALVLAPGEKASDIKVNLAPPDKFDETGVPWTYFLSKIKFQTIESHGAVLIKVTSREVLKEPFLDFLLEVSWPKGSLYREFTVLVDPPAVYQQPTIPVAVQPEGYPPEQEGVAQQEVVTASKTRRARAAVISAGQYGPTVRNDTLWSVSERVSRQTGVSIEQTMIALYEANPQAFYKQNVNALLAGKTLKIPDREAVLKISRQQALDEFNRQNAAWKNRSAVPTVQTAGVDGEDIDNQLTLVAPKQETVKDNAVVTAGNDQSVVEKNTTEVATGTVAGVQEPVVAPNEPPADVDHVANKTIAADDAIKAKVEALEKQLAVMQELISLKDQQLNALQEQSKKKPAVPGQQQLPIPPDKIGVAPQPVQQKPVLPKPVVPPTVVTTPEVEDGSDWYYLLGGTAGVALLAYVGLLLWRKRNQDVLDAENMYAFPGTAKESKPTDVFQGSVLEEGNADLGSGDNLFTSDFSAGDFDMFDMDQGEIDPVSEADVYLAYGRYQQAEELMRHAIQDMADRDEFKLKLLEIFYASENKQAFESYANELFDAGKNSDHIFWAKVVEMGGEICPDSILFATKKRGLDLKKDLPPAASATAFVEVEDKADRLLDETDFDLASFDELFGDSSSEKSLADNNMLFDAADADYLTDKNQARDFPDEPKPNNEIIDFDLSVFSTDTKQSKEDDKNLTTLEVEDAGSFAELPDFDGGSAQSAPKGEESPGHVDFSLDKPLSFKDSVADTSFDDDFDFNTAVTDSNNQLSDNKSFGVSDLTEMDEMEVKLDLAIAYVDMGDNDAAKEIALEVLEKGSKEQQMVAKSLLDNLSM